MTDIGLYKEVDMYDPERLLTFKEAARLIEEVAGERMTSEAVRKRCDRHPDLLPTIRLGERERFIRRADLDCYVLGQSKTPLPDDHNLAQIKASLHLLKTHGQAEEQAEKERKAELAESYKPDIHRAQLELRYVGEVEAKYRAQLEDLAQIPRDQKWQKFGIDASERMMRYEQDVSSSFAGARASLRQAIRLLEQGRDVDLARKAILSGPKMRQDLEGKIGVLFMHTGKCFAAWEKRGGKDVLAVTGRAQAPAEPPRQTQIADDGFDYLTGQWSK